MNIGISEIIAAIIGLLGGLTLCFTFKYINKKKKTKTTQKNNIVAGDMAGRNIKKEYKHE